jgi:hypothetical protein
MLTHRGRSHAIVLLFVPIVLLVAGASPGHAQGIYLPKDGSVLTDPSVRFKWTAVSRAVRYALRVATK